MVSATLEVRVNDDLVFSSARNWLYPLFDLERFLAEHPEIHTAGAEIRDKIVGRASAFLIVRLGFKRVHAGLLSRLGEGVFRVHGVECASDLKVDAVACRTEELLREVTDVEVAYGIVARRAGEL